MQRAVNVQDLSNYEPYELTQAMRTEALEALQHMPGGKQYINMPDLTDMMVPADNNQPVLRRITRPAPRPRGNTTGDLTDATKAAKEPIRLIGCPQPKM